jgi:hypothetical protein
VSHSLIIDSIKNYSSEELDALFNDLLNSNSLNDYLKELLAHIDDISSERIELFFLKMLELTTSGSEGTSKYSVRHSFYCYQCCHAMLVRIGKNASNDLICKVLSSSNLEVFTALLYIINEIEQSYGRLGSGSINYYCFIEEEQLPNIEDIAIKRIREEIECISIFDANNHEIYRFWRYKDSEELDDYIIRSIQELKNVPSFLSSFAITWSGYKKSGWTYNKEYLSKYIEVDELYKKVIEIKESDLFDTLTTEGKEQIGAFYLWYNSSRTEEDEISREDISNLLAEWDKKGEKR